MHIDTFESILPRPENLIYELGLIPSAVELDFGPPLNRAFDAHLMVSLDQGTLVWVERNCIFCPFNAHFGDVEDGGVSDKVIVRLGSAERDERKVLCEEVHMLPYDVDVIFVFDDHFLNVFFGLFQLIFDGLFCNGNENSWPIYRNSIF